MTTRKIYGGDINFNRIFRRILSIGFEYETQLITKLTHVEDYDEDGNPIKILFNSDTARDNIQDLEKTNLNEDDSDYEYYVVRQNETMELPLVKDDGNEDTESKFYVTNDIANSPFIKNLKNYCSNDVPKNDQYKFITDDGEHIILIFIIGMKQRIAVYLLM